jgi:hypothetical protein
MAPFPLNLTNVVGQYGMYLVYLLIGFAFGYVLEIAGFGWSPKLAAQFYFKDMTVLKVMFTAIVVAMVLIFAATGLGLLDYNLIWVNPTYLWPGIVGGLIMGFGFIIGGFCPGTSLVAAATAKIDGLFFVLGGLFGFFLFGETVDRYFRIFWNSSYMGRYTLPELFGLSYGTVVLLVVLMALGMFVFAEFMEKVIGKKDLKKEPRWRFAAAGALVVGALAVIVIGQPTNMDRWTRLAPEKQAMLDQRQVQVHPGELLQILNDRGLNVIMLDVRPESDYNLFHLSGARNVSLDDLAGLKEEFQYNPPNTVYVLMSNDEDAATRGWKTLVAESIPNVYLLEGGINNWLAVFGENEPALVALPNSGQDELCYEFPAALGDGYPAAEPKLHVIEELGLSFTPKVKLDIARGAVKGGCG